MDFKDLRRDYVWGSLDEDKVESNPIHQFNRWFTEYTSIEVPDSTAMIVSTVGRDLVPQTRVVLLKEILDEAFVFYTNYDSTKGKHIAENENISLLFYWPEMERQVRVVGKAKRLSQEKSTSYFNKRPFESRVSAIVSPQSSIVPNRAYLEDKFFAFLQAHPDESEVLKMPENWGGIAVMPVSVEFWQGRISRLHDRLRYSKIGESWKIERLAP
jgi:pyridoxamine 5'-phosphate oxidase